MASGDILKILIVLCGYSVVENREIQNSYSRKEFLKYLSDVSRQHEVLRYHSTGEENIDGNPCETKQNRICVEVLNRECIDNDDIFNLLSSNNDISNATLQKTLPWILANERLCNNGSKASGDEGRGNRPDTAKVWGYGIGFVALVNVISNIGAFLMPCMHKQYFQRLLMFLVGMAAGTLAATGILVLIPEAFGFMEIEELAHNYVWKSATVLAGVYFFFVAERLMQVGFGRQTFKKRKAADIKTEEFKDMIGNSDVTDGIVSNGDQNHLHVPEKEREGISPIAWILLVGDALHNFVDGLSIGAAFTQNVYTGVSVSIAVLCEELPHELGDIAILLHSGMSMKRALLYNFLAAVVCFFGLILGIVLGETTMANRWIFAIAGGMFIYIAVGDLFPEMNVAAKNEPGINGPIIATILHNTGLIVGFIIILLVANYSGDIRIDE